MCLFSTPLTLYVACVFLLDNRLILSHSVGWRKVYLASRFVREETRGLESYGRNEFHLTDIVETILSIKYPLDRPAYNLN